MLATLKRMDDKLCMMLGANPNEIHTYAKEITKMYKFRRDTDAEDDYTLIYTRDEYTISIQYRTDTEDYYAKVFDKNQTVMFYTDSNDINNVVQQLLQFVRML